MAIKKARAIGDEMLLLHHVPVGQERVSPTMTKSGHIGNGKPRFIELVNERAFAHDMHAAS